MANKLSYLDGEDFIRLIDSEAGKKKFRAGKGCIVERAAEEDTEDEDGSESD